MCFVKFSLQFYQAIANIASAKLRSFLALLGIMVGTASVVALVTSGQLATQKALDQFKALGTDLLAISLFDKNPGKSVTPENTISIKEWHKMKDEITSIINIAPYTTIYKQINFQGNKLDGVIIGADESLADVIKIELAEGNFVSFVETYEQYCVIGDNLKKQLKKHTLDSPIGKQLRLGDSIYTIIGIAKPWSENSFFNENINNSVMIPVAGSNLINKDSKINNVVILLKQDTPIEPVIEQIKTYVNQHAPELNVFPRSAKQIIKSMQEQGQIFTLLLGLIGGISLLVGGIGVMNVMLVSVTERKREIGIRKAIGAKRKDIQALFLIESSMLAFMGGVLGVIVGLCVSFVIAHFSNWNFHLYLTPPLVGFLVSAATGIFFGFYPAYRASILDPIESLRYE
jgi:putative ABC transport system permease protein